MSGERPSDHSAHSEPSAALGIGGFTFADLHQPARLRELYNRFVEQVKAAEPELWSQWAQYREVPESLTAIARGNIVVAMAPHVSRFVAELFSVGPDVDALKAATRAYDALFRFKIDFVRRRALPLLKAGAHVEATAEDHALVARIIAWRRIQPKRVARRWTMTRRCGSPPTAARSSIVKPTDKAAGRRSGDRIAQALVCRAPPRSEISRLGRVSFSREPRLRPSRARAAPGSEAARGDGWSR